MNLLSLSFFSLCHFMRMSPFVAVSVFALWGQHFFFFFFFTPLNIFTPWTALRDGAWGEKPYGDLKWNSLFLSLWDVYRRLRGLLHSLCCYNRQRCSSDWLKKQFHDINAEIHSKFFAQVWSPNEVFLPLSIYVWRLYLVLDQNKTICLPKWV